MRGLPLLMAAALLASSAAYSEKPAWAGKNKGDMESREMREERRDSMREEMEEHEEEMEERNEEMMEHEEEMREREKTMEDREARKQEKMEKLREKRGEEDRKEMGKGSEQGQSMREEHSRKWWRFWE